jgi:hypothetical protein
MIMILVEKTRYRVPGILLLLNILIFFKRP